MAEHYILSLDQGTTSSRAMIFNHAGQIVAKAQKAFAQHFPEPGLVEHDAKEIWSTQVSVLAEALAQSGIAADQIAALAKTGLVLDAYFSATKVKWILDHVPGARARAEKGELCFGTVDTWLVWNLTEGRTFVTDPGNASRTMLFNIHTLQWDEDLLALFDIPRAMLPEVKSSSEIYGHTAPRFTNRPIAIAGIAGDQQAALFGQLCLDKGMLKNTYGTGCFLLMNTGDKPVDSQHNLLATVAWKIGGKTTYALEGGVFVGGAAIQWLRDGARLIREADEINTLAASVADNGGVYFVPALSGMGAPYWDQYARGSFFGITRGTSNGHLARAVLEGIAFQVYDIVKAMEADAGQATAQLRVDGGASQSDYLMQVQSDLFAFDIVRPRITETTALGAAYLAGLAVGFWQSTDELRAQWQADKVFSPQLPPERVQKMLHYWHKAVKAAQHWIDD